MGIDMSKKTETFTYDDAEQVYGEVTSAVFEIISELGAEIDDPRIADLYKAVELQLMGLYSYTNPPSR
jgi:hypothetical protein